MQKTYACPIHGQLTDDDLEFDKLWTQVGCPACAIEKVGKRAGVNPWPNMSIARLAGTPIEPGTEVIRMAARMRIHADDIEKVCADCGHPVYLRPYGPMDCLIVCMVCGVGRNDK